MTEVRDHELTQLLRAWSEGDDQALEKLVPLVYTELHRLARHYMAGERAGHTLQTSALVNEAYLRLVNFKNVTWQNRAHFFGVSAGLMRRILVDPARHSSAEKRKGIKIPIDQAYELSSGMDQDLVAVDDALKELAEVEAGA